MVLTALSQDKAATLLGVVARLVHHVDNENVIRHELRQAHMARVPHLCGVVARPMQAAGGFFVLKFLVFILPGETEYAGVGAPCLQDTGDGPEVVSVAGEVQAAPTSMENQ